MALKFSRIVDAMPIPSMTAHDDREIDHGLINRCEAILVSRITQRNIKAYGYCVRALGLLDCSLTCAQERGANSSFVNRLTGIA